MSIDGESDLTGDGAYHRPNQPWVCGRLAHGRPCPLGPDRRGHCRVVAACEPRRDGDNWICTRANHAGGACADGPLPDGRCCRPIRPCQPLRSFRAMRGAAVRWAAVVTIGILAILFGRENVGAWLSPGELTMHHAQIDDCGGCHDGFKQGPVGWIHQAVAGLPEADAGDGKLCLNCHRHGDQPFAAHSVEPSKLAALTDATRKRFPEHSTPVDLRLANAAFSSPMKTQGGIGCANCHAEHGGTQANLRHVANPRCQSCHELKFDAFGAGHPPFEGYPHKRRTRIQFDHAHHITRHFAEAAKRNKTAPETCATCHVGDATGRHNLLRGFEATCAACHDEEVRGIGVAGALGLPVFALPGLDIETLRERNVAIGAWPELADGKPTPFMRLLLARDAATATALARFEELDPLDLTDASADDLETVRTVAWASKAMVHDLLAEGPASLLPTLRRQLGPGLDEQAPRDLLGGLSIDIARRAQRDWFPDLADEIRRHRAGESVPLPADPTAPDTATAPAQDANGSGDILDGKEGNDSGDILGGDKSDTSSDDILGGDKADTGSDDILGDDKADSGDILGGDKTDGASDDILGDGTADASSDDILGGDGDTGTDTPASTGAPAKIVRIEEPIPENWSELGGWYVDGFAVWYRPRGHADPFLRAWMTLGADSKAGSVPREIFEDLATVKAPGKCAKCHSIDAREDGTAAINWQGLQARPNVQDFTEFAHAPHFEVLDGMPGCGKCHKLDTKADYTAAFSKRDPHDFVSNFKPIRQAVCAECHTATAAGNDCTTCHDYHIGDVATKMPATRLDAAAR